MAKSRPDNRSRRGTRTTISNPSRSQNDGSPSPSRDSEYRKSKDRLRSADRGRELSLPICWKRRRHSPSPTPEQSTAPDTSSSGSSNISLSSTISNPSRDILGIPPSTNDDLGGTVPTGNDLGDSIPTGNDPGVSTPNAADLRQPVPERRRHNRGCPISILFGTLYLLLWIILSTITYCPGPFLSPEVPCSMNRFVEKACRNTGLASVCPYIFCSPAALRRCFPKIYPERHIESSGQELAIDFSQTYNELSQAVAASIILYQKIPSIDTKRKELFMDLGHVRLYLPLHSRAGGGAVEDFLDHSSGVDMQLDELIYKVARLGDSAIRRHATTHRTLATIQQSPHHQNILLSFILFAGWKTGQEREVQWQLKSDFDELRPQADQGYLYATKILERMRKLQNFAENMTARIEEDRFRLKAENMKTRHIIVRVVNKAASILESTEVTHLTQILKTAEEILRWTRETATRLEALVPRLEHAMWSLDGINDALVKQNRAIRWEPTEEAAKIEALSEFLVVIDEGMEPLKVNTYTWCRMLAQDAEDDEGRWKGWLATVPLLRRSACVPSGG